jgi:broad specificity phosphatase PhoE
VSEVVRLTLISHAMTDAMAAARFPDDEPLNALGQSQIHTAVDQCDPHITLSAPERRALDTADLLGLQPGVEPRLADLDVGRWRGHELAAVPPEQLATWLSRPESTPHGGESVVALITRVHDWMDDVSRQPARLTAVTHPAVIRAAILIALESPPKSFWRIDIEPASRTVLHFRGRWTLRWGQR